MDNGKVFANVKYFTSGNIDDEIEKGLKIGGAQTRPYLSDLVTHLVCGNNFSEDEVSVAAELYSIVPVTEKWVIASIKLGRLASTKAYNPLNTNIFSRLNVAITNLGLEDRNKLYGIITYFGGRVQKYFNSRTTHLITGVAAGNAYNKALSLNNTLKIVSPDWIIDCVKRKELINADLYHPRLLKVDPPKFIKLNTTADINKSLSSIIGFDDPPQQQQQTLRTNKEILNNITKPQQTQTQQQQILRTASTQIVRTVPAVSGPGNIILTSLAQTQQGQQQVIFVRPKSVQHSSSQPQQIILQQKYIQQPQVGIQQQQQQQQNVSSSPQQQLQITQQSAISQQNNNSQQQLASPTPQNSQVINVQQLPRHIKSPSPQQQQQQQQQQSPQQQIDQQHQQRLQQQIEQQQQLHNQQMSHQQQIQHQQLREQQLKEQNMREQQQQMHLQQQQQMQQQQRQQQLQQAQQQQAIQQIRQQLQSPSPQPTLQQSQQAQQQQQAIQQIRQQLQSPSPQPTVQQQSVSMSPQHQHLLQQHILRQQILQQQQQQQQQQGNQQLISQQQQGNQQLLSQQQQGNQQLLSQQQQQTIQRHIQQQNLQQLQIQQQPQQQQHQQSPKIHSSQSPNVNQENSPQSHVQQGTPQSLPSQSPLHQPSPSPQMTPPPAPPQSPQAQAPLTIQQQLRQQIQQGRSAVGVQQQIQVRSGISQVVNPTSPSLQQQILAFNQQQQKVQQQMQLQQQQQQQQQQQTQNHPQQLQQQVISKQILLTKPIDPTDPNSVAQLLSRATPSPQQQHEQSLLMRQHLAQQQLKNQHIQQQQQVVQQSPQHTAAQAQTQISQQSPHQSPQQQIIVNQGNHIITQRHVINTSTAQGQQIIQSHMLNIQQQKQQVLQQQQQQQQQVQTQSLQQVQPVAIHQKAPIGMGQQQFQFAQTSPGLQQVQQVRIIQGQQIITDSHGQSPQHQHQQQPQQSFQHIVSTQQPQQQVSAASQTTNKQHAPFQKKVIISQQQFNQLNSQQLLQNQQILQNQQNQNIIIINQPSQQQIQSTVSQQTAIIQQQNIPASPQGVASQQQGTAAQQATAQILPTQQQIPTSQQHSTANISQMLKTFTQKQQSQQQLFAQQTGQLEIDTTGIGQQQQQQQTSQQIVINQPNQQQTQQHQVVINSAQASHQQQQQPTQIVINPQQTTISPQRLQYLQSLQQHQLQLQLQNKQQIVGTAQLQNGQQIIIQQSGQAQQTAAAAAAVQTTNQQAHGIAVQSPPSQIQIQNQIIIQQPQQNIVQQQTQIPIQSTEQSQTPQVILQQQSQVIQQQSSGQQQTQTVLVQQQSVQTAASQPPALISQPQQQQQINVQQQQQQQQILVQQQQQSGVVAAQSPQQWNPQNSGQPQQQPQGAVTSPMGQHQFIRTVRPQWQPGTPGPQRQLIQLDDKAHAQFLALDPIKKAEYIAKLNKQRLLRQHVAYQPRPGAPNVAGVHRPTGTQHIIVQSQMPPGLTQQQQMQWLQQQGARQVLVRSSGAPGLSPISQQAVVTTQQFPVDGSPVSQNQQQLILQRQQQQQLRLQQLQIQREQAQKNQQQVLQTATIATTPEVQPQVAPSAGLQVPSQQTVIIQETNVTPQQQMNSKTKTALANMLNSRLSNTGATIATMPDGTTEHSAAGTLRMMTAQHNAALTQAVAPRTSQELLALQQQQQRRTLGSISNGGQVIGAPVVATIPTGQQVVVPQSPSAIIKGPPFSPVRTPLPPRPQFYGHNPNLKLPSELFLLGCTFFIVEYDEMNAQEVPEWMEAIVRYGGEIEKNYCQRVTHVLCRTQRHGVVMQAIRDSKRCVTAYWLQDTIAKKQVIPPWQALHLPFPSTFGVQKPATRHIMCISGFENEERERIKQMVHESGAKLTVYMSKHNTVLICRRPEGEKYKRAKIWNIPVVNTAWLSDIVMGNLSGMSQHDNAKYQQYNLSGPFRIDHSLVAHLMAAWKAPINLTQEAHERLKRSLSEPSEIPKPKRIKVASHLEEIPENIICNEYPKQDTMPKICFSQVDNMEGLTRAVSTLGGIVVKEPENATHLIMTRTGRSCKFLRALCTVEFIVHSKWIVDSSNDGKFLPIDDKYKLDYKELEDTFKFNIDKTLKSPIRHTLFSGKSFHVTPSVFPPKHEIVKLIESAGGKVEDKRRTAAGIAEANSQSYDSYIVITCPHDLHLMADLCRPGKPKCLTCSTETIMSSIMKQKMEIEPYIIQYYQSRKY